MNTRQALPQMHNLQSIRYRLHYVVSFACLFPVFRFHSRSYLFSPPRSLQNNDINEPVISALLPLLSTRTALRTIELVHCCHQDEGPRVSSSASATHAATQPAAVSGCWSNISILSQLLLLKNVNIRFNHEPSTLVHFPEL